MGKITLEQIDLIMQRTHVSYAEAKEALEAADGDILEAILIIEKKGSTKSTINLEKEKQTTDRKSVV